MIVEYPLIPLVEEFIRRSSKAKRLKANGKKLAPGTIDNYRYMLRHLKLYEEISQKSLRVTSVNKLSKQKLLRERRYWKRFYLEFTDYLYKQGCYDNYTGTVIKNIRAVFNYIEKEKQIDTGGFHKEFYVVKEEIPVITLMPSQLQFLINNKEFEESLANNLKACKDIFVFGCTVALRFGDLMKIEWKDIQEINGAYYLVVTSQKSKTETRVKLPAYAVAIIDKLRKHSSTREVFPYISLFWFNKCIQKICEKAGWCNEIGKARSRRGVSQNILHYKKERQYRFCDIVSSHIMRRTAITTMLMHNVPESIVKKISGHSGDSKSFHRYINLVQSFMDAEVDKHFEKLNTIMM